MQTNNRLRESLVVLICLLSMIGCLAIFIAQQTNQYDTNFFRMQIIFIIVGFTAVFLLSKLDMTFVRANILWVYVAMMILLAGVVLLLIMKQPDLGTTIVYFVRAFTIGLMPLTGIPLPFISYSDSSTLGNMIALGIILAVIKCDDASLSRT
nr:FtsW/RodA/SpoVE family cell cycle protein [Listeria portnoyi]